MKNHEQAEFEAFVAVRSERLRQTAYLVTGSWPVAEDVVVRIVAGLYPRWRSLQRRDETDARARRAVVRAAVASDVPDTADPRLAGLTPEQRAVLVLRLREGLTASDTAHLLGVDQGRVEEATASGLAVLTPDASEDGARQVLETIVGTAPPTTITTNAVRARGVRALRRRQLGAGSVGVAATAALVVGLLHPWSRTAAPGTASSVAFLPFETTEQVAAAQTRVYQLLLAEARKHGTVLRSTPPSMRAKLDRGQVVLVAHTSEVQFAVGPNTAHLVAATSDPLAFTGERGLVVSMARDCPGTHDLALNCVRTVLPKGAVLWTREELGRIYGGPPVHNSTAGLVAMRRVAVLFDADGSAMLLTLSATPGASGKYGEPQVALSQLPSPSDVELGRLAEAAAAAWQGAAPDLPASNYTSPLPSLPPGGSPVSAFTVPPPPSAAPAIGG